MDSVKQSYIFMLGIPGSGKTTYLAALWHTLNDSPEDVALTLDRFVGNHQYMNEIVDSWHRCMPPQRTSLESPSVDNIPLRNKITNQRVNLRIPDIAGELFNSHIESRTCSVDHVDSIEQCNGILLFVNANRKEDSQSIRDTLSDIGDSDECGDGIVGGDDDSDSLIVDWNPSLLPVEIRVIDLLQMMLFAPFIRRRRDLAIVVSAWDVVTPIDITPSAWVGREFPLLRQFLAGNADLFRTRIFGVSAQGGSFESESRQMMQRIAPSVRIYCISDDRKSRDILEPIQWIMDQLNE